MSTQVLVTTGPESCGKTTLATQLATLLHAPLVPECARDYLWQKKQADSAFTYGPADLLAIARLQHQAEQACVAQGQNTVICDTDLLVIIIWSEVRFGRCNPWIARAFEAALQGAHPRRYFLCDWRIPWQTDPLRENPHDREDLFERYRRKLLQYGADFSVISGSPQQRLHRAGHHAQAR